MPRVTLEFELPAEQRALEDALAGADAVRVLESMQRWLSDEASACARAKLGSAEFHYARGIANARDELARLASGAEESEREAEAASGALKDPP